MDGIGLTYLELKNEHLVEGYVGSIENTAKGLYQGKASLRNRVDEMISEFLYSLKGENRIFCQISGEYLQEPYIFISREYLSRNNIPFFNANYGFLGGGAYYYQLDSNDESECDVVFEVEDIEMLKKLVQKYGDADALALLYIPSAVGEPLEKLKNLYATAMGPEPLETSLREMCDFILLFEADGDSLRLKSSNRTKTDFWGSKIAEFNRRFALWV